jgi:tyrosinase
VAASFTRNNALNEGGTFENQDLLWYARGVRVMMDRRLDDPTSWWFFAAIHGQAIGFTTPSAWGNIPGPPSVPTTPLPAKSVSDLYWDQCQHLTWYFAPWHRGYLMALEMQIRTAIGGLNPPGPTTWALPYWNYFGPEDEEWNWMPRAFNFKIMPDGMTPNPLFVLSRYGPVGNGREIFVRIPPVSDDCMTNSAYTGGPTTIPPGFGGFKTGFWHTGGEGRGSLENNPHNFVHGQVGGRGEGRQGLMSNALTAALDPIFYLHHANIDRMWMAWNTRNPNPTDANWLNGPTAAGDRKFVMPLPDGTPWTFKPGDLSMPSQLRYTYDDLSAPAPLAPAEKLTRRLMKLGAVPARAAKGATMEMDENTELVGANDGAIQLKSLGARAAVTLAPEFHKKVVNSLRSASAAESLPDAVYLELQNVRGNDDAFILDVSVNQQPAGSIGLFGLEQASAQEGEHGGSGLTFVLDISNIVDNLFINNALDVNSLAVRIAPNFPIPDSSVITIGRISVYRRGQR